MGIDSCGDGATRSNRRYALSLNLGTLPSDQKVVLITGVSSGIGSTTAEHLVSRGYRVFGTARSPQEASAIPGVSLLPLDVTLAPSGLCA